MKKTTITIGNRESSRIVLVLQFIFGLICIGTALMWGVFILKGEGDFGVYWPATIFMAGFGLFQIFAGLGKTTRYITVEKQFITIKKYALLGATKVEAAKVDKISTDSTGFKIHIEGSETISFRFGLTQTDRAAIAIEALFLFAQENSIPIDHTE